MKKATKYLFIVALAIAISIGSLVVAQARYFRGGDNTWYDILQTCRDGSVINVAIASGVQPSVIITGTLLSDGATLATGTYLLDTETEYVPGIGFVPYSGTLTALWNTSVQPGSRVRILLAVPLEVPLEATVEDCYLAEAPAAVESTIFPDPTTETEIPPGFVPFSGSSPACITVTIPVTLTQPVGDLNLAVLVNDLLDQQASVSASLTSPAGTSVQLLESVNGNMGQRCKYSDTNLLFDPLADFVLDDDSVFTINNNTTPYNTSAMKPEAALNLFRGEDAAGDWTLEVCNHHPIVSGGLWCAYLEFDEAGTVSGHLYLDNNGNGAQEGGEPDVAGVDVLITDSEVNLQTASSDANGNWIATVPPGNTTVVVDQSDPDFPAGATQTEGEDPTIVTAAVGVDIDAGNDGYYLSGMVSGHLYKDIDGSGSQGAGEPGLENVDVIVTHSGSNSQTVATNTNGYWSATVPPGTTSANVDESDPDFPTGYTQTEGNDPTTVIAVAGADTDTGSDGYYLAATLVGHLYLDINASGAEETGEPGLANVDVIVTDSGGSSQTVASDANGDWNAIAPPGITTVSVNTGDPDFPSGAVQTEGSASSQVSVLAGEWVFVGNNGYFAATNTTLAVFLPLIVMK